MTIAKSLMLASTLLTSLPVLAQEHLSGPDQENPYHNADGTRTADLEAAAATWRALPQFQFDYAKGLIRAEYAYARGITGRDIVVGVADNGIDPLHPMFQSADKVEYLNVRDSLPEGFVPRPLDFSYDATPNYLVPGYDHGMHVAGTIGGDLGDGEVMGVAPNVTLVSGGLNLGNFPILIPYILNGKSAEVTGSNASLMALSRTEASIVNSSWGGATAIGRDVYNQEYVAADADVATVLRGVATGNDQGLSAIAEAGKINVIAAGNSGGHHAGLQASRAVQDRALEPYTLAVTNLTSNGTELHQSSDLCGQTRNYCLSAPGTDIRSAAVIHRLRDDVPADFFPEITDEDRALYVEWLADPHSFFGVPVELPEFVREARGDILITPILLNAGEYSRWYNDFNARFVSREDVARQMAERIFAIAKYATMEREVTRGRIASGTAGYGDVVLSLLNSYTSIAADGRPGFDGAKTYRMLYLVKALENTDADDIFYHLVSAVNDHLNQYTERSYRIGPKTGTSMAAPHVSGALALVMERFPYLDNSAARDILLTTATDIGEAGVDIEFGWGRMNIEAAMDGPGALLRTTRATLLEGQYDVWANDISDGSAHIQNYIVPPATPNADPEIAAADAAAAEAAAANYYRGSLIKDGAGTLVLTGQNSYLGDTQVEAGRLVVNGALTQSQTLVSGSGILSGAGRVHGLSILAGGTVSPGNSPGTMEVTGDLRFAADSTYEVETTVNMAQTDLLQVTGNVTIEGGRVLVRAEDGGWNPTSTANIITSQGDVTGTFAGLSTNLAFLTPSLAYGQRFVALTLARNDQTFEEAGETDNQGETGAGIDDLMNGGGTPPVTPVDPAVPVTPVDPAVPVTPVDPAVPVTPVDPAVPVTPVDPVAPVTPVDPEVPVTPAEPEAKPVINDVNTGRNDLTNALLTTSLEQYRASVDSLSGEVHASLAVSAVNDAGLVRDLVMRRMPHSVHAVGYAREGASSSGWSGWAQGIAGFSTRKGSDGVATLKSDSRGVAGGIDRSWDDRVNLGAFFAYVDSDARVSRLDSQNNNVASYHAGAYFGAEFGAARIRLGGSYGWYDNKARRSVSVNRFVDQLASDYKGRSLQAFGELGLGFESGAMSFEPFAGVAHVDYDSRAINERGGDARLVGKSEYRLTTSTVGLRTALQVLKREDGRTGYVRLSGGWRHDLDSSGAVANLRFSDGARPFRIVGAEIGKDVALVDFAVDLPVSRALDIGFTYGGQFSNVFNSHNVKLTAALRF
jgi:outer membrane autotransporter protein